LTEYYCNNLGKRNKIIIKDSDSIIKSSEYFYNNFGEIEKIVVSNYDSAIEFNLDSIKVFDKSVQNVIYLSDDELTFYFKTSYYDAYENLEKEIYIRPDIYKNNKNYNTEQDSELPE